MGILRTARLRWIKVLSVSKRGLYLGGHTVVKAPRPWWQGEDIPLEATGHLNAGGHVASDLDSIQLFMTAERALIRVRKVLQVEAKQSDRDAARDALTRFGENQALQIALENLRAEIARHPREIQRPYLALIAAAAQTRRKGTRLGKRERAAKRQLKRIQFSRGK